MLFQLDWAYVDGENWDHHLLRGQRFTMEETSGDAWHGAAELSAGLTKEVSLSFAADFLMLSTTGSHRLLIPGIIDYQFSNGVRVWSEQVSFSLTLAYAF
jgi:hypothetical protein